MSRARALRIAAETRAAVAHVLAALPPEDVPSTAAVTVQLGRDRAAVLGDVTISERLGRLPLGLVAPDAVDRITDALTGILSETDSPDERIGRLAEAEPMSSWRASSLEATRGHDARATRIADSDPCPLCESLQGPVPDFVTEPLDHPGCACRIEPIA